MRVRFAPLVVAAAALVPVLAAADDEGAPTAKPDLRQSWPTDLATSVAVPLGTGRSLVVALPAHLWIQGPCNTKTTTTFAGDGIVLQDIIDMRSGNSHSIAYVGAVALPKPARAEAFDERFDRFVQAFVADLPKAYARVDFEVAASADAVKAERTEIAVDGKAVPGWRTSRHATNPAGLANKPGVVLASEVAFLGDEPSNSCLYLVSSSKMQSLTLDQLLENLSIQTTVHASGGGHRVQLLDISAGRDENYPVRLATYAAAPGFAPTLATLRLRQEFVYAEDRVDDKGRVTGTWRIGHRDRDAAKSLADEVEKEILSAGGKGVSKPKTVDLGTAGAQAFVFTSRVKVDERAGVAATAVLELEDKLWAITWTTFGDDAAVKADEAAFEALLHGMQLATR